LNSSPDLEETSRFAVVHFVKKMFLLSLLVLLAGCASVEDTGLPSPSASAQQSLSPTEAADPALVANPNLPVAFVFNKDKLAQLQLSAKRLIFYIETLQDLASRREVQVYLGTPYDFAADRAVAVTYAPVPSFKKFENLAEVHPYPWLRLPHSHSLRSFSAWRKKLH
jgi:uncharacterized protein YceK